MQFCDRLGGAPYIHCVRSCCIMAATTRGPLGVNSDDNGNKKLRFLRKMKEGRRERRDGEEWGGAHCGHKPETARAAREKA